jgi:predicted ATP pyrophosphatase (TIGR00289 family)
VLFSGGKDSSLALYRCLCQGYKIKYLVSLLPKKEDSWMFHYPNIHLIDIFSEATGFPVVKYETSGIKEEEIRDLKNALESLDVDGVVSGAIGSQYQKTRIDKVCAEIGLKSITPLWKEEPLNLLNEIISLKFETIICGVYAYGFNENWLGEKITNETVERLLELNRIYGISIMGEGGEYETLTLNAPFFKKRIEIVEAEKIWKKDTGHLLVKKARLVEK